MTFPSGTSASLQGSRGGRIRGDTGDVTAAEDEWTTRVQQAAVAKDGAELRVLFLEAQVLFGDAASHRWSEVLSAFDSSAVTG